jgi:DNA-binding transcriptional ArsR family regulator
VLRYELTPMDVTTCRFGISPLNEMCLSLRSLRAPGAYTHRVAETYVSMPESRGHRETLLALVNDDFSTPDVINPRPETPSPRLGVEMRSVASTPAMLLSQELDRLWPHDVPGAVQGVPRVVMVRVLEALESYWTWAFAAFWTRHRSILEADVRYRASRCAGFGLMDALSELHPSITFDDASLCAHSRVGPSYSTAVSGRRLVFVPSLFTLAASHPNADTAPPMVIYPARGQRQVLTPEAPFSPALLLGQAKTDVMAYLVEPRTTTELAALLGKTASAVNQQLHDLRRAGLVSGARTGKSVLYSCTPSGRALMAQAEGVTDGR